MKKLILALGLVTVLFTSCEKEELPSIDNCERGKIVTLGTKLGNNINNNIWYYVWFKDDCSGKLIRRRVSNKDRWESLEIGDYYEWTGNGNNQ